MPTGHNFLLVDIDLSNHVFKIKSESWTTCCPKVKARHFLERVRSTGQSVNIVAKKLFFLQAALFVFLLDKCQLDLFEATTSFSRVTLTLALSVRHSAYAFPLFPYPLPRLHMHKPMSTTLVLASQIDVFPFLPFLSQDAHTREALPCARIVLGSVWQGSHSCPPGCLTTTLSVLTSLSLFLGVLFTLVQTTPFGVVLTHLDRPSSLNGCPPPKPCRPFVMLFVLRSVCFLHLDLALASCYAHAR